MKCLAVTCLLLISQYTYAVVSSESFACMAGASADIDGSTSGKTNSNGIQFLLTFHKVDGQPKYATAKYTGMMDGYPESIFTCKVNEAANYYSCIGGSEALWFYPKRNHGVRTSLNVMEIMGEDRLNAAGVYNYSCSKF